VNLIPISLTYDNESLQDGVGAQVLRIVTLRALSDYYHLGYVHSGISKLTVTQLDPAQTTKEITDYISYLNEHFSFESTKQENFDQIYDVYNLSHRDLIRYSLRALISRKRILLRVTVPFYITNKNPKIFESASKFLPEIAKKTPNNKFKIVIHFRAGANPEHIDPGKTEARFISIDYFEKVVFKIMGKYQNDELDLCLLTDAPLEPFNYSPPVAQLELWAKAGYQVKNGSIEIRALDLEGSGISRIPGFRVVHGGDPIDALKEMSTADFLIMSRSTLSFLGALLNQSGKIIYPPRFGSEPLAGWIAGEDYVESI
jgi:hypothetical protein